MCKFVRNHIRFIIVEFKDFTVIFIVYQFNLIRGLSIVFYLFVQ